MKVRGTIKKLNFYNQNKSTTIQINYIDILTWKSEMVIFQDDMPAELKDWKENNFDISDFDDSLFYQFYKERQVLSLEIEKIKDSGKYKIISLEIVDE